MRLNPFRAFRYDDPGADPAIALGVMDVTSVVSGESGFSAARLVNEPELFSSWVAKGVLTQDAGESLYAYRSGTRNEDGLIQTCGVIGLVDEAVVDVDVVKVDAPALGDLIGASSGILLARATDSNGTHHRLWAITQTSVIETINELAASVAPPTGPLVAISPEGAPPPRGFVFATAREIEQPAITQDRSA